MKMEKQTRKLCTIFLLISQLTFLYIRVRIGIKHYKIFYFNRFRTEELRSILENESAFGFIVVDGNGALFAKI
jgi:hypothetical protein